MIPTPAVNRTKQKWWDIVIMAGCVGGIFIVLLVPKPLDNEGMFTKFMRILLFTFLVSAPAARLLSKKHPVFIEVNAQTLLFRLSEYGPDAYRLSRIAWEDIKWIKQENDLSISLYQASSFNSNFSIKAFSQEEQQKLLKEIGVMAAAKQIPLVNFSAPLV